MRLVNLVFNFSFTGEKPYICVICGKRFTLPYNLKSHLKFHQDGMWSQQDFRAPPTQKYVYDTAENNTLNSNYFAMFHNEVLVNTLFHLSFPSLLTLHTENYGLHMH